MSARSESSSSVSVSVSDSSVSNGSVSGVVSSSVSESRVSDSNAASQAVQIWLVVGTLHGCDPAILDDAQKMSEILEMCTRAGGLTLLHRHVHQFQPQGVTATAVLAESHIALHTWPEQGVLFVDIATCSNAAATQAAFQQLCSQVPHSHQKIQKLTVG